MANGYPAKIDPKLIYVAIKLRRKFSAIEITIAGKDVQNGIVYKADQVLPVLIC